MESRHLTSTRPPRPAPDLTGEGTATRLAGAAVSGVACATLIALIAGGTPVDSATVASTAVGNAAVGNAAVGTLTGAWGGDRTGGSTDASPEGGVGRDWRATADQGSAYSIAAQVGAAEVWDLGLTGRGVAVAVVDTGISPVAGLDAPGKVVLGADLSSDAADNVAVRDGLGHGTHMAALIAGRDEALRPGREHDPRYFAGMAPNAALVDVRVGARDGDVDAAQVVAGIDWVVAHHDRLGIRVLNLSYGAGTELTGSSAALLDAVDDAWRAGVVVVVAAGNDGTEGSSALTMPAASPYVIAVGSTDHRGSASVADDRVGAWTNTGTTERRPDLLAPGKSVVSLRVPGSSSDVEHPEGLVAGDRSGRLFRGTGTSQSAAIVSGAAALLLQRSPELTPDQVKGLLVANADLLAGDDSAVQGAGLLDVAGAVQQLEAGGAVPAYRQAGSASAGAGVLRADAGTWNGRSWNADEWNGRSWNGRSWNGRSWNADEWSGRSWNGRSWNADEWSGRSWSTYAHA